MSASLLTLNIPEDVLFWGRSVKDIQSHCVHTILLDHVLRIEAVMLGLAHLFKSHLHATATTGNWFFTCKRKDAEISSWWGKKKPVKVPAFVQIIKIMCFRYSDLVSFCALNVITSILAPLQQPII